MASLYGSNRYVFLLLFSLICAMTGCSQSSHVQNTNTATAVGNPLTAEYRFCSDIIDVFQLEMDLQGCAERVHKNEQESNLPPLPTLQQMHDFYALWESGDMRADINDDGGVDGSDVEAYWQQWAH